MTTFEICVETPDGAAIAAAAGVDRIELCSALDLGGLTPGAGLVEAAVAAGCRVHMMVRPRAGGFVCTPDDVAAMLSDIRMAGVWQAYGIVCGAALADGRLDLGTLAELKDAAGPMEVTLHRVIDLTPDPLRAVDQAAELGLTRILTSGGPGRAADNVARIAAMVRRAAGRIEIMAGGGVTAASVPALLAAGVDAIHASCAAPAEGGAPGIGIPPGRRTDAGRIAELKAAIVGAEALCA